jgi:hypothetical protein
VLKREGAAGELASLVVRAFTKIFWGFLNNIDFIINKISLLLEKFLRTPM